MTLKELNKLTETLINLSDFAESNSDADESGIADEMAELFNESMRILGKEKGKLYLRNAMAKLNRERK